MSSNFEPCVSSEKTNENTFEMIMNIERQWYYRDRVGTCWQICSEPMILAARRFSGHAPCTGTPKTEADIPYHIVRFLRTNPKPKYLPKLSLDLLRRFCANALKGQAGQIDHLLIDLGLLNHALQWLDLYQAENTEDDYCTMLTWRNAIKFLGSHWRTKIHGVPLNLNPSNVVARSAPKLTSHPCGQTNRIQVVLELPKKRKRPRA